MSGRIEFKTFIKYALAAKGCTAPISGAPAFPDEIAHSKAQPVKCGAAPSVYDLETVCCES
jgi:hypothetical protein